MIRSPQWAAGLDSSAGALDCAPTPTQVESGLGGRICSRQNQRLYWYFAAGLPCRDVRHLNRSPSWPRKATKTAATAGLSNAVQGHPSQQRVKTVLARRSSRSLVDLPAAPRQRQARTKDTAVACPTSGSRIRTPMRPHPAKMTPIHRTCHGLHRLDRSIARRVRLSFMAGRLTALDAATSTGFVA